MSLFTPMKVLDSNLAISKLTANQKQPTSLQLKAEYLQHKLSLKTKKLESYQTSLKQQQQKIDSLSKTIAHKDHELRTKGEIIEGYKKKVQALQGELAKKIGEVCEKARSMAKRDVETVREKQEQDTNEKLNKMLTKENAQLIAERHAYKKTIAELTDALALKQAQIQKWIENSALVSKLNEQLKLQIEQLLFQIRMSNRRQEKNSLMNYENGLSLRAIKRNQREEENGEGDGDGEGKRDEDEGLVQLLKLKVESLEEQLLVSERRCKQLQLIILAQ